MIRNFLVIALVASFTLAGSAHAATGLRGSTASTTPSATTIACVGSAVSTREASLITAIDAHGTAVKNAYTARKTALAAAYVSTNTSAQIRTAVKAAWTTFRNSTKAAKTTWKNAQRAAWQKYRTDIKACRAAGDLTADSQNAALEAQGG